MTRRLLPALIATCLAPVWVSMSVAAENNGGLSIEWAYLATYPEADCTKVHVYVKNTGSDPVAVKGLYLGDYYTDVDDYDWNAIAEATPAACPNWIMVRCNRQLEAAILLNPAPRHATSRLSQEPAGRRHR